MLLETQAVVKRFGTYTALDRIDLQVSEGCIFGLLGPNGAGKTTLIRIINQITAPDEGRVLFEGKPLRRDHIYQVGYLPEERGLYRNMKVGEQAVYLAKLKGLSHAEAVKRLHEWFGKFGIDSWWNRKINELSKGMQQKVQFICTVLHRPKLLIFDEPFSGFDPVNAQLLKDEILELKKQGSTIIFSTHNMASVEEICDEIALLNHGRKILGGTVQEVRRRFSQNVYRVVLGSTEEKLQQLQQKAGVEILEQTPRDTPGFYDLRIKASTNADNDAHTLLKTLMEHGSVKEFTEKLPGMNDIFIQCVKEESHEK